jgi:glycogen synthase
MPIATIYFQLHQPFRLHPARDKFLWDDKNKEVFEKVAEKNYLPATKMFTRLIADNPGFKITFSMSGTFLEQAQLYKPEVIKCLQDLFNAGKPRNQVEFLEETYYHSLVSLFGDPNRQEFRDQVALHRAKMEELFGLKPSAFRNTELMFNNDIAAIVADMGFKAMLCEKRDDMFGLQNGKLVSPNAVFKAKGSNLIVLPRNRELSDDVAFRFPHTPISSEQYAESIAKIDGEAVLLGYDYEHLGEHIWKDKGIFEFWQTLPKALAQHGSIKMANPSEVVEFFKDTPCPIVDIHGLSTSSWADSLRNTYGWLGNKTQQELFSRIERLESKARTSNGELQIKWRQLTTSDHLYFLHESSGSDHAVHSYFSPYGSIGETVRTLTDKIWSLEKLVDSYFHILKKTTRIPVIIISPETDRLPTKGLGDFAQYVSGKSGGMGEVVAALCRGLSNKDVLTYIITLNLERKFVESSGISRQDYIQNLYHLPRDKIKTVDSPLFENYRSAYDGDPKATAAEFQRQIRRFLIGEILSKHEGRGIIHSHDWMSGGIITAFARHMKIPILHTVHNSHTGHIPLEMFHGVNLGELWANLYFSNDRGRECVDCQATAIKNANLVSYVGTKFLEETIRDYFLDRHFIPPSVREETKAKYRFGTVLAIPNGISPSMYPENQVENPEFDKPGLAKKYGTNDNVVEAKKLNLVKFQKKTGLQVNPEAIMLYWPSRLDRMQKGIELIEDIALKFVIEHPDAQIGIIGNPVGDDRTDAEILGRIACASGGKITYLPFDDDLSMLGYAAASDVFGASLYEPFGQIDLVGNLFGATATNRDTGGFHDKIVPLRMKAQGAPEDIGNGVLFKDYDSGGLWQGLETAVRNHRYFRENQSEWEKQAKRMMRDARANWGLNKMVAGYLAAYQRILGYPLV